MSRDPLYAVDLFETDIETINNFVFQTNSHFFWIDDIHIGEHESRLRGMVLNPLDEIEYSIEYQLNIHKYLEINYLES